MSSSRGDGSTCQDSSRSQISLKISEFRNAVGWHGSEETYGSDPVILLHEMLWPYSWECFANFSRGNRDEADRIYKVQKSYLEDDNDETDHRHMEIFQHRYIPGKTVHGGKSHIQKVSTKEEEKKVYALKRLDKPNACSPETAKRVVNAFMNEIQCMKKASGHTHVVSFVESVTSEAQLGIIMEPLADINLREFLEWSNSEKHKGYNIRDRPYDLKAFLGCLLRAILHLRNKGIRHRDIKPENILIVFEQQSADDKVTPKVVLCDFGLSHQGPANESNATFSNSRGTPKYKAPELSDSHERHDEKTDVWSLGCVFFEMHVVISECSLPAVMEELRKYKSQHDAESSWTYVTAFEAVLAKAKRPNPKQIPDIAFNARVALIGDMVSFAIL